MSFERFKKNVDFFYAGGVPAIHICATGEPFLHPDIMRMIDYVIEVYGEVSFQSNFNEQVIRRHDYITQIIERKQYISYITSDAFGGGEFYELVKKGSSWAHQLEMLKILSDAGITLNSVIIVTKQSYKHLLDLIEVLIKRSIKVRLFLSNIFPHGFNEFTGIDNVFLDSDEDIKKLVDSAKKLASHFGIEVFGGAPFNSPSNFCSVFWDKIQVWPVAGIDKKRYCENLVPHGCNAVVLGEMNSLGYIDDYSNVMEWWNSPKLVQIREKILSGKAPDKYCNLCPFGHYLKT